jgi:hypothetical protein
MPASSRWASAIARSCAMSTWQLRRSPDRAVVPLAGARDGCEAADGWGVDVGRGPPADGSLEAADAQASAHWTLDALAHAAQAKGIQAGRSQVRRILQADGVRWRTVRSWSTSGGQEFAPNKRRLAGWCCAVGCTTAPAAATLRVAAGRGFGSFPQRVGDRTDARRPQLCRA